MLVLSRKLNESIILGDDIRVVLLGIRGNQVRLGIQAPERLGIIREELVVHVGDAPVAKPDPSDRKTAPLGGRRSIAVGKGDKGAL